MCVTRRIGCSAYVTRISAAFRLRSCSLVRNSENKPASKSGGGGGGGGGGGRKSQGTNDYCSRFVWRNPITSAPDGDGRNRLAPKSITFRMCGGLAVRLSAFPFCRAWQMGAARGEEGRRPVTIGRRRRRRRSCAHAIRPTGIDADRHGHCACARARRPN